MFCKSLFVFSEVCVAQCLVFCVVLCRSLFVFSGVCVAQYLVLCRSLFVFSGLRLSQSLIFCVIVGSLLDGFVWINL